MKSFKRITKIRARRRMRMLNYTMSKWSQYDIPLGHEYIIHKRDNLLKVLDSILIPTGNLNANSNASYLTLSEYEQITRVYVKHWCNKLAPNLTYKMLGSDEVMSNMTFEVMKADAQFDNAKSSKSTFRQTFIKNAILEYLTKLNNNYYQVDLKSQSIHSNIEDLRADSETLITQQESKEIVQTALSKAKLTQKQRECINMYFFDNLKITDIASKLNVTTQAVYCRLTIALKKLRRILNQHM